MLNATKSQWVSISLRFRPLFFSSSRADMPFSTGVYQGCWPNWRCETQSDWLSFLSNQWFSWFGCWQSKSIRYVSECSFKHISTLFNMVQTCFWRSSSQTNSSPGQWSRDERRGAWSQLKRCLSEWNHGPVWNMYESLCIQHYINVCVYIYTHVIICMCIYIYICMYVCVFIYIHVNNSMA